MEWAILLVALNAFNAQTTPGSASYFVTGVKALGEVERGMIESHDEDYFHCWVQNRKVAVEKVKQFRKEHDGSSHEQA